MQPLNRTLSRLGNRYAATIPHLRVQAARLNILPLFPRNAHLSLLRNISRRKEFHSNVTDMVQSVLQTEADDEALGAIERQRAQLNDKLSHPCMSIEKTWRQYSEFLDFVNEVELIDDRGLRALECHHIRYLLARNENSLRELARSNANPAIPRIHELQAVIVSMDTAAAALGDHVRMVVTARAESWSERPWFWEAEYWSVDYQRRQKQLQQRDSAWRRTGLDVPRPALVRRPDVMKVIFFLACDISSKGSQ